MRLSIDLFPLAEMFSSFVAVNELAIVTIVLVTVGGSMDGPIDVLMQTAGRAEGRLVDEDQSVHNGSVRIFVPHGRL